MKRLSKIGITWSPELAYAIGLITADGSLSNDGRHIDFTSKDKDLVILFKKCLRVNNKVGRKARGSEEVKRYYRVQFGDRNFYEFLLSLGLMPAKSKKIRQVKIPNKHFADFLRGCIDGDGNINIFRHPESSRVQLRIRIVSASKEFLYWLHNNSKASIKLEGGWIEQGKRVFVLTYAKQDAIELLKAIYYSRSVPCLKRKRIIVNEFI